MGFRREDLCVVLVEPTDPGNVGATARAMNNMGVSDLRLVRPCPYQNLRARQMAAHSEQILHQARVFKSLPKAVEDRQWIIATTARARGRIREATELPEIRKVLPEGPSRFALVYGTESRGLTNDALALCHACVHIPTFGTSGSLNLAQAVMVCLYELSKGWTFPSVSDRPAVALADSREIEGLKSHGLQILKEIRFLKENQEKTVQGRFSNLIARAGLTALDVRLIRGFFHRIEVTLIQTRKSSCGDRPLR